MSRTNRRERKAEKESPKPIPLPPDAQVTVKQALSAMRGIENSVNSFVSGVRAGLRVPKAWVFDQGALVFRPGTAEELAQEKKRQKKQEETKEAPG